MNNNIELTVEDLKILAARSKQAGKQDKCIDMLLEIIEQADKTIKELEASIQKQQ